MNSGRTALSATELAVLVLLDGKATVAQVRTSAASLPPAAVDQALEKLLRAGLVVSAIDVTSDQIDPGDFFVGAASESEAAAAKLKHHGYFVKRQHDAMKDVRIIMMTAKATREAVLKGLARGADGYVTKPFEVDVLLKAVKTVAGLK